MLPRLYKEIKKLQEQGIDSKQDYNLDGSFRALKILYRGPKDSPYEGYSFILEIVPDNFPFKAPKVRFLTPIFHSMILEQQWSFCDYHCPATYGDGWAPTKTLHGIIKLIDTFLKCPVEQLRNQSGDICVVNSQAQSWFSQKKFDLYEKTVKEYCEKYGKEVHL